MKNSIFSSTIFVIICLFFNVHLYSQINPNPNSQGFSMPEISRPSPGVSQLMKVEETNVSHYTGQPNISVPLYSKNIDGFDYSLGLVYNVSGIRPDENSSWVGRGWSLEGSGAVSRTVQDLPDEILVPNKYIGVNYNDYFDVNDISFGPSPGGLVSDIEDHNGFVYTGQANEYFYNSLFGKHVRNDTKRDIYQFNALGRTGRFIFVKDEYNQLVPMIIGDKNGYDISFDTTTVVVGSTSTEIIDSFTITDASGYKFYFDQIEETQTISLTTVKYEGGNNTVTPSDGSLPFYRSSWKLSAVFDSNGVELISFGYDSTNDLQYTQKGSIIDRYRIPCSLIASDFQKSVNAVNNCDFDYDVFFDADPEGQDQIIKDYFYCVERSRAIHDSATTTLLEPGFGGSGGGGSVSGGIGSGGAPGGGGCDNNLTCDATAYEPVFSASVSQTTVRALALGNVVFRDSIELLFNREDNHPEYIGGYTLSDIEYYVPDSTSNNLKKLIKKFDFKYHTVSNSGTSQNTSSNDPFAQAPDYLTLTDVDTWFYRNSTTSNASLNTYKFEYNPFQGTRENNETDDFGYYKDPDHSDPRFDPLAGSLLRIIYPTSGSRTFIWEANSYSFQGDRLLTYDQIIENPDNYSLQYAPTARHDVFYDPNAVFTNTSNTIPSNYQYVDVSYDQDVTMIFDVVANFNYLHPYNIWIWYEAVDQNDNPIPLGYSGYLKFKSNSVSAGDVKLFLEAGRYRVNVYQNPYVEPLTSSNTPIGSATISMDLTFITRNLKPGALNWWIYGGGLRVKEVKYSGGAGVSYEDVIDYRLEPHTYSYSTMSNNGYPMPDDYPGNPNLLGDPFPVHNFSSGSIDGEGSLRREYVYKKAPLHTQTDSGILADMLIPYYYTVEKRSALSNQLTQGSYIGYKNIAQYRKSQDIGTIASSTKPSVENESVTKYTYDSPLDYNFHPQDYIYPFPPYESDDFLRGNLRKMKIYDQNNRLIKETIRNYNYDTNDAFDYIARDINFSFNPSTLGNSFNLISKGFDNYQSFINMSASQDLPTYCGTTPIRDFLNNSATSNNLQIDFNTALQSNIYYEFYKSHKVQMTSSTEKNYFYDGTESLDPSINEVIPNPSKVVTNIQNFEYNTYNYLPSQTISIDSKGDQIKSKTYYVVGDVPTNNFAPLQDNVTMDNMRSANIISVPLVQESYFNDELMSQAQYVYTDFGSGKYLPTEVHAAKGDEPMEVRLDYHRYDKYGNILEVSKPDGTRISYIWGHNNTLPIAKIEGMSYTQLAIHLLGSSSSAALLTLENFDESNLSQVDALRDSFSLEDPYLITTYEYEVGVGIIKMTNPRSEIMTYHYDDFNRLEYVKDQAGNRLSENQYKYATQN